MQHKFVRSRDQYLEEPEKEGGGLRKAVSALGVVGIGGGLVEGGINLMRGMAFFAQPQGDPIARLTRAITGREQPQSVIDQTLKDLRAQFEDDIQSFKVNEGIDENAFLNVTSELMRGVVSTVVNPMDRLIGGATANVVTGVGKKLGMKALQSQAVKVASGVVADSALNVYYSERFVRDGYSKQDFVKDLGTSIVASYIIQGGFKGLSKILTSDKMKSISRLAKDNASTIRKRSVRAKNLETISKVNDIADTLEKSGLPITDADRASLVKNTYDTTRIEKYSSVADTDQFRIYQSSKENLQASQDILPKIKKKDQVLINKGKTRTARLARYEKQLETKTGKKGIADLEAKIEKTKKELDDIDSELKKSNIGTGEKNEVLEEYNKAETEFNALLTEKFGDDFNTLDMMQELDNVMDDGDIKFDGDALVSLMERAKKINPLEVKGEKIDVRAERAYDPEVIKGIAETDRNVQELDRILTDLTPKIDKAVDGVETVEKELSLGKMMINCITGGKISG